MSHPNRSKANRLRKANPTAGEVRAAREAAGHTPGQAAAVIYANTRQWERWEEGAEARMHPGLFELYLLKTGKDRAGSPQTDGPDPNLLAPWRARRGT